MLKKVIVIAFMLALFGGSLYLASQTSKPQEETSQNEGETIIKVEEKLPEQVFSFNAQNLSADCTEGLSEMFCAVENAVKCTLKPDFEICTKSNLPSFIFMTDPTAERPTEMNYKFINKEIQPNGTTRIYTESSCNGGWFGLCQGTVIYVLGQNENKWLVKDIYAIE